MENGGQGWVRTNVGVSQKIYSLPPLTARAPTHFHPFRRAAIIDYVQRLASKFYSCLHFLFRCWVFYVANSSVTAKFGYAASPSLSLNKLLKLNAFSGCEDGLSETSM